MADFEGLINQALAKQNAADPVVRDRIYQSSRNALIKMLEKAGNLSDDAVRAHFDKLEASIASIESRYAPLPEPVQQTAPEPINEPEPQPIPEPEVAQLQQPAPTPPDFVQEAAVVPTPEPEVLPTPTQPSIPEPVSVKPVVAPPAGGQVPNAPQNAPQRQPVKQEPEGEKDIIAELEALIPEEYQPAPLFPPVEAEPVKADARIGDVPPSPASQSDAAANLNVNTKPEPVAKPQQPAPAPMPVDEAPAISNNPIEPYLGDVTAEASGPETVEDFSAERDEVRVYKRKNPLLRRIWPIFLALAVVLVILWILYALLANMPNSENGTRSEVQPGAVGETQKGEDGNIYITLLEPTDLSALVTAGRGSAELISQRNRQMLRIQSVRQGALTGSNAEPILLELGKGVLKQISGKEVTVEFYAQSGESGAAQFAIECDFAGDSICGRKRFRVGAQPERIVFALDLTDGIASDARAYLAINTDITNAADASGTGDALDIIYVRLRLADPDAQS